MTHSVNVVKTLFSWKGPFDEFFLRRVPSEMEQFVNVITDDPTPSSDVEVNVDAEEIVCEPIAQTRLIDDHDTVIVRKRKRNRHRR